MKNVVKYDVKNDVKNDVRPRGLTLSFTPRFTGLFTLLFTFQGLAPGVPASSEVARRAGPPSIKPLAASECAAATCAPDTVWSYTLYCEISP